MSRDIVRYTEGFDIDVVKQVNIVNNKSCAFEWYIDGF